MIDSAMIGIGIVAVTNVAVLGAIYGKMSAQLTGVTDELRGYVKRNDDSSKDHSSQLRDHSHRITRLEARVLEN